MKISNLILALLLTYSVYGQEKENIGKSFEMIQNFQAKKCDAFGKELSGTEVLERSFVIVVEGFKDTSCIVSVPRFTKSPRKDELNKKLVGEWAEKKDSSKKEVNSDKYYFIIPIKNFKEVCEKLIPRNSFVVGIPTVPTKLRFGSSNIMDQRYFRFEGNLNLGLSVGWKRYWCESKNFSTNAFLGFTLSSIAVDSITTKGKINTNTSVASFSPHIGVVFDAKKFQFGIYTGIDLLNGETNNFWVYRNQPWIGIGLGFNLFNTESGREQTQK